MLRPVSVLLVTLALAGCASHASGEASTDARSSERSMRTITAGTPFTMRQGETVRLPDDATLKYVSVPQDSRCPPNARCIRAGDADITFEFAIPGGPTAPVKPNLPEAPSKNMGAWRLTVESLEFGEAPNVTVRVDPAQ
jgi:hypothetical protein